MRASSLTDHLTYQIKKTFAYPAILQDSSHTSCVRQSSKIDLSHVHVRLNLYAITIMQDHAMTAAACVSLASGRSKVYIWLLDEFVE
jgi:hypothetical protein